MAKKQKPKKSWIQRFWYLIVIAVVVLVAVSFILFQNGNDVYEYYTVHPEELTQEVDVSGRVKAVEAVDLAFQASGQIAEIKVEVNDKVFKDDVLIELDNDDALAEVKKEEANVAAAKATLVQFQADLEAERSRLNELKNGTRVEQLEIDETAVNNAKEAVADAQENLDKAKSLANAEFNKKQQDLEDAKTQADDDLASDYTNLFNSLHNSFTQADDAVNGRTRIMMEEPTTGTYRLSFSVSDSFLSANAVDLFQESLEELDSLDSALLGLQVTDEAKIEASVTEGRQALEKARDYLVSLSIAVGKETSLTSDEFTNYQLFIGTSRTSVENALSDLNAMEKALESQKVANANSISSAESAFELQKALNDSNISLAESQLTTAENSLENSEKQLQLGQSGSRDEAIFTQEAIVRKALANVSIQQAQIDRAESALELSQSKFEDTIVRSPIDGIITQQFGEIGELAVLNERAVSVISESEFEIEAQVSEIDIAKINEGNSAKVTLDAYGSDFIFDAVAAEVYPAEQLVDGIPNYIVIFKITESDPRILSGMTANVVVLTQQKDNVLSLPLRAVTGDNGGRFVRLLDDRGNVEVVSVETGFRASNGFIEISSGLEEGDQVILSIEEK